MPGGGVPRLRPGGLLRAERPLRGPPGEPRTPACHPRPRPARGVAGARAGDGLSAPPRARRGAGRRRRNHPPRTLAGDRLRPRGRGSVSGGAPGVVEHLLEAAVSTGASDVHLEPSAEGALARLRIDGLLLPVLEVPGALREQVVQRVKALADLDLAEHQRAQDGRFVHRVAERSVELRVSVVPCVFGESVVLRVLDREATGLTLGGLGAAEEVAAALRALVARPQGLVLVCGPTGSGKTTTLYAMLGEVDRQRRKVLTVEDPIEYELEDAVQLEVNPRFGVTFASAVRAMLRQDPDVILVGEIRDPETALAAVEASLTGHLVLATVHATSTRAVVRRLIDLGVPDYLLEEALAAAVGQRLLRRLCRSCRRPRGAKGPSRGEEYRPGEGCRACAGLGYRGRRAVFEVVRCNPAVARALLAGEPPPPERLAGGRDLRERAREAVARGETSREEVERVLGEDALGEGGA
ncbi:MAG: type II/IV secretion system protein [Planctomycetota bacterium]|nr:MAG: type II/IV secretion system protein [Planctomycetota bacterium]